MTQELEKSKIFSFLEDKYPLSLLGIDKRLELIRDGKITKEQYVYSLYAPMALEKLIKLNSDTSILFEDYDKLDFLIKEEIKTVPSVDCPVNFSEKQITNINKSNRFIERCNKFKELAAQTSILGNNPNLGLLKLLTSPENLLHIKSIEYIKVGRFARVIETYKNSNQYNFLDLNKSIERKFLLNKKNLFISTEISDESFIIETTKLYEEIEQQLFKEIKWRYLNNRLPTIESIDKDEYSCLFLICSPNNSSVDSLYNTEKYKIVKLPYIDEHLKNINDILVLTPGKLKFFNTSLSQYIEYPDEINESYFNDAIKFKDGFELDISLSYNPCERAFDCSLYTTFDF